jgi:hypothetical protein
MTGPASAHGLIADAAREAAGRRLWAVLLADPPAECATTADSAGSARPLGAGARLHQTHEDRTYALQEAGAAFEEDNRRDRVTSTVD